MRESTRVGSRDHFAIVILGFKRCVNNWCYQHGTNDQYTKCQNASEDGRTCYKPTIRYGTAIGGRPQYPNLGNYQPVYERNVTKTWCHQLFPEYSMLSYQTYSSYPNHYSIPNGGYECYNGWVAWCDFGDEQNPHWCAGKGSWKDCQSCLQHSVGICTYGMKSVTCNFPKT